MLMFKRSQLYLGLGLAFVVTLRAPTRDAIWTCTAAVLAIVANRVAAAVLGDVAGVFAAALVVAPPAAISGAPPADSIAEPEPTSEAPRPWLASPERRRLHQLPRLPHLHVLEHPPQTWRLP